MQDLPVAEPERHMVDGIAIRDEIARNGVCDLERSGVLLV